MYRVLILISLLALALAGKKPQHQSALQHQHFRSKNVEALSNQADQRFKSKTHGKTCETIKSDTTHYDDDTKCFDVGPGGSPVFEAGEEQEWGFIKWLYKKSTKDTQRFIKSEGAWVVSKLDGHLKGAKPVECQSLKNAAFDQRWAFIPARNVMIRTGTELLRKALKKTVEDDACLTKIRAQFAQEFAGNGPVPQVELVNKDYCWSGKSEAWGVPGKSCPSKCIGEVGQPDGKCHCESPCETDPNADLGSKHTCDGALATIIPKTVQSCKTKGY